MYLVHSTDQFLFELPNSVHGAQIKNGKSLKYYLKNNTESTETCYTAMERQFYGVSEDLFKNCQKPSYKAKFGFSWQMAESAHAQSN